MKLKVTRSELNECINNAFKRLMNEGKDKRHNAFEKATKSANREREREIYGDGFKSYDRPHKSPKDYSRKGKGKFVYNGVVDESYIDLSAPGDDNYYDDGYDTDSIPDIKDIVGSEEEYHGEPEKEEPKMAIKTDIDKVEQDLIGEIQEEFPDAEYDIVDDCVAFNIPKRIKKSFVRYLLDNDVNLIK